MDMLDLKLPPQVAMMALQALGRGPRNEVNDAYVVMEQAIAEATLQLRINVARKLVKQIDEGKPDGVSNDSQSAA